MELQKNDNYYGQEMYELAKKLFPICRSITGKGFRESLFLLDEVLRERERERERERGSIFMLFQVEPKYMIG